MTTAERLACIKDAVDSNNREIGILCESNNVFQVERQRLLKKAIEEDGMLAGAWEFHAFNGNKTILHALPEMVCKLDNLSAMLAWHYHESFYLDRDNLVRVDDGHYSLILRTADLGKFIAKYGIAICSDGLRESITDLVAQIAGVRETLEQIESA